MANPNIKLIIVAILLGLTSFSFSQRSEIDSLYHLMDKAGETEKLQLVHQIHMLMYDSDPAASLDIANQGIELAVRENNTEYLVYFYEDKCRSLLYNYEYDSAFLYACKGKELAQKEGMELDVALCAEMQGAIFFEMADFEKGEEYYLESLNRFEKIGDSSKISRVCSNLGLLYKSIGENKKASEYCWRAYELIDTVLYPGKAAVCFNNLGSIYLEGGDRAKALVYYQKALEINKRIGIKRNISVGYYNIGNMFLEEREYAKALEYHKKSLNLSIEISDQIGAGISYISLCDIFEKQKESDSVFFYASRAEKIFLDVKNDEGLADAYFYKGEAYYIKKDYPNSINEYRKCVDISRKISDNGALAKATSGLGISYYKLGNFRKALECLQESVSWAEENRSVDLILKNYNYIADSYSKISDKSGEVEFLRKYITLKDSVFTLEKEKMASELLVKYEVAKTEAELEIQKKEKIINRNKFVRQRILTIATGIVLLLSIFIVFLVYKRYRQKQKTNDLLRAQSLEIEQKQKEIEKQNLKLEEQAKGLQELDNLKSRFYSNISHEFRTPLSLIIGPLESLIPKTGDKELKYQLDLILRNARKLFGLINQILDLSKIDKGSLKVKLQYGDINKEAGFITELFSSYARERKLELQFKPADGAIHGYFDVEKLERILNNLISNAIKNTVEGKVEVTVHPKGKEKITLMVSDTGRGIAKEDLPHIFERFYRVENKNASGYIGSGIGLAFTKELVQLLKGNIRVASELNKGSVFMVTLPIDKSVFGNNEFILLNDATTGHPVGNAEPTLQLAKARPEIKQTPGSSETILVVEDHEELRGFICNSLSDKYKILQAENGEAGIAKAGKHLPDVIVTDITMPKVDGIELTKTLKNNKETSHIPIIILTAKASHESKMIGLKTRADDYLSKPFNVEELKVRIDNLLNLRQGLREKYMRSIEVNPTEITTNSIDEQLIARALKAVEENMSDPAFSVEMLCGVLEVSRSYLHNKLKSLLSQSATEFINTIRVKRAAQLIRQNAGSISEIAYDVGFSSLSYFSKTFKKHFKILPSEMQEAHFNNPNP